MADIQPLRDLTELAKHNLANTLFEAMNSGTVTIEREEATKLVRILNTTVDASFQIIAEKESRPKPKARKTKK